MTERMMQISREMHDLCAEVNSLQVRALLRVEEIENELGFFNGKGLKFDNKENFKRLQTLITKV